MKFQINHIERELVGDDMVTTYTVKLMDSDVDVALHIITADLNQDITWRTSGYVSTENIFYVCAQAAVVAAAFKVITSCNRKGKIPLDVIFEVANPMEEIEAA